MKTSRILNIAIVLIVLAISCYVCIMAYSHYEWGTIASALAVIAAISTVWSSMSLNWKLEDEHEPFLNVYFESQTHKYCTSLVIRNDGGSTAYNIRIRWENPLKDALGKTVRFTDLEDGNDIHSLPKGMHMSRYVKATEDFFSDKKNDVAEVYEGVLEYNLLPKSRKKATQQFRITMEPFKRSLMTSGDQMNFYFENQSLTKKIDEFNRKIENLIEVLNKRG